MNRLVARAHEHVNELQSNRFFHFWENYHTSMAVNLVGVAVMVIFYLLVLGVGLCASFKSRKEEKKQEAGQMETILLANHHINWVIETFTMSGDHIKCQ